MNKVENNYLYIAENKKGIIKIGVTKNNPYERVENFSTNYTDKFDLVTYFNVKNIDKLDVETFFHEIFNSQFLNINYLYQTMLKINEAHEEIVTKKLNGYTELFVENKNILKNLLIFLNMIDVIDLKTYDIDEVNKIKNYVLNDVKTFKKYHKDIIKNEYNKLSLIKPVMYNTENLLSKNTNNFFGNIDAIDFKHLSIDIDKETIFLKFKDKKLSITNFIYGNLDPHLTKCLIKTKTYKKVYFEKLVNFIHNLRQNNQELSTQLDTKKINVNKSINNQKMIKLVQKTDYQKKSNFPKKLIDSSQLLDINTNNSNKSNNTTTTINKNLKSKYKYFKNKNPIKKFN